MRKSPVFYLLWFFVIFLLLISIIWGFSRLVNQPSQQALNDSVTLVQNLGSPNTTIESFSTAKRLLMNNVYNNVQNRRTLYCDIAFSNNKNTKLPKGFDDSLYTERAKKVEFEHIVPADDFGDSFKAWREGDEKCVSNGKTYKGRKCATLVSEEFRLMQADSYNLYAAVGSVNAYRSNYDFQMLPFTKSDFGSCDFRVDDEKVQPPERARGIIARTYLYMDATYPSYSMSREQRQLFIKWDREYPVTEFECEKARLVKRFQKNDNVILQERCG